MIRISADKCIYSMNSQNPPVTEVEPGATVVFETKDCFSNQLHAETDLLASLDWATINPATGPLRVRGARPGQVLAVRIEDIKVALQGTMIAGPGIGAVGKHMTHAQTKIVPVEGGEAVFGVSDSGDSGLRLPLRPMIGVIGTAPAPEAGDIPDGTPGVHGGNMDCKLIGAGTTLYLPVFVEGANLAMGDLHAVMADGEVVVCGVEVAGEVTVKVELVDPAPGRSTGPVLETDDAFYCIASGPSLDEAAAQALDDTLAFLRARLTLPANELGMLMSLVCDVQICQVVDPLKTARVRIPKTAFGRHRLEF